MNDSTREYDTPIPTEKDYIKLTSSQHTFIPVELVQMRLWNLGPRHDDLAFVVELLV